MYSQQLSDEKWKSSMARGGGNKKIFQYCIDPSGQEILYLRALQGHSGRNLIDPSLQDTGRTKFEQKTDGILYVCGSYEQRTAAIVRTSVSLHP